MTNIVELLWTYLGGVFIGCACISLLYIAGLSVSPRRYLEKPHSFEPSLVLGAAIFIIWCWYGIKLEVALIHLIRAFGCLAVLLFFVGRRWQVWDFGAMGGLLRARGALFVYAWFYLLA